MESARARTPAAAPGVAAWADGAFARLADLRSVHRVGLAVVEGGGRRLRFTANDRDGSAVEWCDVDAYDDVPLNAAVRSGRPVVGELADLEERFAEFARRQQGTPTRSLAAVPITTAGKVLGGYVLYFQELQPFDRRQLAALVGFGRELGAALVRALHPSNSRPAPREAAGQDDRQPAASGSGHLQVAVHEVPADLAAVSPARQFLRDTLTGWGVDPETVDTATLCLSELVTNALIHSHGGCLVRVVLDQGTVTTSVLDAGVADAAPVGSVEDPMQVHGRGLQLVDALADRWGHEVGQDGATVWFALDVG